MNRLPLLVLSGALVSPLVAIAAEKCSIHPPAGATQAELIKLATVSQVQAQHSAMASLKGRNASVVSSELEAEDGCLIWSFDLKVTGRRGIQELWVDAGDGKIIASKHESPRQEAVKHAQDAHPEPKR